MKALILTLSLFSACLSAEEPVWLMPMVEGPNLHYKTFHSAAVKGEVSYVIYLPKLYERESRMIEGLSMGGSGEAGLQIS